MQEGQCLCTRKSPCVLLTIPCAYTPSQHAPGVPEPGRPRRPSFPPTHHPATPPKRVRQEDDSRVPLAGAVVVGTGGCISGVSSRETWGLRKLRKLLQVGRESRPPCRRRGSVP
uniref:FP17581 n=1 Tax=Homo sapiens TaxID=9606 RepID=Q6XYE2_HUMAN|nr:FP17581 [Homo sapiens]